MVDVMVMAPAPVAALPVHGASRLPNEVSAALCPAPSMVPAPNPLAMPTQSLAFWRPRWRRVGATATGVPQKVAKEWTRANRAGRLAQHIGRRRRLFFGAIGACAGFAGVAVSQIFPPGDTGPVDWLFALFFVVNFTWIAVSFWTAVAGAAVILRGGDRLALRGEPAVVPAGRARQTSSPPRSRTVIVMPVYNEDSARVFARLEAMWVDLHETGRGADFDAFVLSDSSDSACQRAEEAAWHDLVCRLGAGHRIFYRRRDVNHDRKSGNIAEFCRTWGGAYRYMVVLDADSLMAGETLVRLVDMMEANPRTGLIQTVPTPVNRRTLFGRMQQFGCRLYRPVLAMGAHYWQLGDGNYWGHNAIIRIAPFARHCGLPHLPGRPPLGGPILSHDFVEAALLRRAGWHVWSAPMLGGTYEESPPTLIDHAKRDRRWCQGNLQHLRLVMVRGLHFSSRLYFAFGGMAYVSSLTWLLFLLSGWALMIARPDGPLRAGALSREQMVVLALLATSGVMLYLPRFLGLALALSHNKQAGMYGGRVRLALSALLEMLVSVLLAPIMMLFNSATVIDILIGRTVDWTTQQRGDNGIALGAAIERHWGHTLCGLALVAGSAVWAPALSWWLSPVYLGLCLSVPLSVLTSRRSLGLTARRWGLFQIPEELAPTRVLQRFHHICDRPAAAPDQRLTLREARHETARIEARMSRGDVSAAAGVRPAAVGVGAAPGW